MKEGWVIQFDDNVYFVGGDPSQTEGIKKFRTGNLDQAFIFTTQVMCDTYHKVLTSKGYLCETRKAKEQIVLV